MWDLSPVGCDIWQSTKSRANILTSEQKMIFATWNLLNLKYVCLLKMDHYCFKWRPIEGFAWSIVYIWHGPRRKFQWMVVVRVWDDVVSSFIMFWGCRLGDIGSQTWMGWMESSLTDRHGGTGLNHSAECSPGPYFHFIQHNHKECLDIKIHAL